MTIQTFIEKAIEGGWKPKMMDGRNPADLSYFYESGELRIWVWWSFLQPDAWRAVGKVEGKEYKYYCLDHDEELEPSRAYPGALACRGDHFRCMNQNCNYDWATYQMHRMIDALAEGKTIEQYLETL
jgi:hypothetical protein